MSNFCAILWVALFPAALIGDVQILCNFMGCTFFSKTRFLADDLALNKRRYCPKKTKKPGFLEKTGFLSLAYGGQNVLSVAVGFHLLIYITDGTFAVNDVGDALGITATLDIVSFGNRTIRVC